MPEEEEEEEEEESNESFRVGFIGDFCLGEGFL